MSDELGALREEGIDASLDSVREAFHAAIHDGCGEAWIETEIALAALVADGWTRAARRDDDEPSDVAFKARQETVLRAIQDRHTAWSVGLRVRSIDPLELGRLHGLDGRAKASQPAIDRMLLLDILTGRSR